MARGYGMALLAAAISVAYLIHSSSAQTTFTVGDTTGWTVPQNVGREMVAIPGGGAAETAGGAAETEGVKPGEAAPGAEKTAEEKAAEQAAEQAVEQVSKAPPAKNSATSLGFAGFTTFLSIFVALCY